MFARDIWCVKLITSRRAPKNLRLVLHGPGLFQNYTNITQEAAAKRKRHAQALKNHATFLLYTEMSSINLYLSSQQKAVFQVLPACVDLHSPKNRLQASGMLKGKHSNPSYFKIKKEQCLIILLQLRFMLMLVFHTFQPINVMWKFFRVPW